MIKASRSIGNAAGKRLFCFQQNGRKSSEYFQLSDFFFWIDANQLFQLFGRGKPLASDFSWKKVKFWTGHQTLLGQSPTGRSSGKVCVVSLQTFQENFPASEISRYFQGKAEHLKRILSFFITIIRIFTFFCLRFIIGRLIQLVSAEWGTAGNWRAAWSNECTYCISGRTH